MMPGAVLLHLPNAPLMLRFHNLLPEAGHIHLRQNPP